MPPLAPAPQVFRFADGGQAQFYTLDKSLQDEAVAQSPATLLFVVGGADCSSMQYFLPDYFRGLEGDSGPLRIVMLQKRFIGPRTWGRTAGCSDEFIRADYPDQWLADQAEFIRGWLAHHPRPARLALLGISEGGEIVPLLAQRLGGFTHLAILGNGGMPPLQAYRLQAHKAGFAGALDALQAVKQTPPDPDAVAQRIHGRSWRYWSQLQQIDPARTLLQLNLPVLVGMGAADKAVPLESAWYLQARFAEQHNTRLTLLTYPDAGHDLVSAQRAHLPDFMLQLDRWLMK